MEGAGFGRKLRKAFALTGLQCEPGEALYLVGGSHRALARYAMQATQYPLDDPHGFEIEPEPMLRICRSLSRGKLLGGAKGISASRLASLPDAAAQLAVLIAKTGPSRLVFSSWGLREGLIFDKLDATARAQDPLLAGVNAFTENHGCPATQAVMVAGWTAAANPADGDSNENLRLAATMLAIALQRLEPNLRADHAMDWALRKRWIGVRANGRAMLAAAMLANTGQVTLPEVLQRLASPEELRAAQTWGLAIRLCRRFSGLSPQVLANSALEVGGSELVLTLDLQYRALFNEAAEKDLRNLAVRLGLKQGFRPLSA